eukprot:6749798-Karenia_brevis.AAC.1
MGKVPYERVKGKKPTVVGIELGEKVLYMRMVGAKMEKIKSNLEYGIYVGVNRRSNELLIADEEGTRRVRSRRRIPKEEKWSEDNLKGVKWAPWTRYEGDEEADGEMPEGVKDEERKEKDEKQQEVGGRKDRVVYVDTRGKIQRNFKISKEDVDRWKATTGCFECSALKRGMACQPHSPA